MPESVPNYLFTDVNGLTGAAFPGGIILPSVLGASNPSAFQSARWTIGGGLGNPLTALIYSGADNALTRTLTSLFNPDLGDAGPLLSRRRAELQLQYGVKGVNQASASLILLDTVGLRELVLGISNGGGTTPLSSFAQLSPGPFQSQVLVGGVTAAGAVNYGKGFTVVRTGVGTYDLTYTVPFGANPAFIVGTDQGTSITWDWQVDAIGGPIVHTAVGGVLADVFWNFIAIAIF